MVNTMMGDHLGSMHLSFFSLAVIIRNTRQLRKFAKLFRIFLKNSTDLPGPAEEVAVTGLAERCKM